MLATPVLWQRTVEAPNFIFWGGEGGEHEAMDQEREGNERGWGKP